ncbi:MAG: hypothetical protein WB760_30710 [Xanthobacteraceae bacterium]
MSVVAQAGGSLESARKDLQAANFASISFVNLAITIARVVEHLRWYYPSDVAAFVRAQCVGMLAADILGQWVCRLAGPQIHAFSQKSHTSPGAVTELPRGSLVRSSHDQNAHSSHFRLLCKYHSAELDYQQW